MWVAGLPFLERLQVFTVSPLFYSGILIHSLFLNQFCCLACILVTAFHIAVYALDVLGVALRIV
jgi:hypothetical protein